MRRLMKKENGSYAFVGLSHTVFDTWTQVTPCDTSANIQSSDASARVRIMKMSSDTPEMILSFCQSWQLN